MSWGAFLPILIVKVCWVFLPLVKEERSYLQDLEQKVLKLLTKSSINNIMDL